MEEGTPAPAVVVGGGVGGGVVRRFSGSGSGSGSGNGGAARTTSSVEAAKSMGAAGSAVGRLQSASAVNKHRSLGGANVVEQAVPSTATATATTTTTSTTTTATPTSTNAPRIPLGRAFFPDTDADADGGDGRETPTHANETAADDADNDEFEVVNPMYQHSGGARFRSNTTIHTRWWSSLAGATTAPTSSPASGGGNGPESWLALTKNLALALWELTRMPVGEVRIRVERGAFAKTARPRVRLSLNGAVEDVTAFNTRVVLPHMRLQAHSQPDELDRRLNKTVLDADVLVEVYDAATDVFLGSTTLSRVDVEYALHPTSKAFPIYAPLDAEPSTPGASSASAPSSTTTGAMVGTLEMTVSYHRYTLADKAGLRWARALAVVSPTQLTAWARPRFEASWASLRALLKAGLVGWNNNGGAGSWVVFAAFTLPYLLVRLLTNWSPAVTQWFLVVPVYAYLSMSLPVLLGWMFASLVLTFGMHGYPGGFKVGALHVTPWIRGWALQLRITVYDMGFGNPPGFGDVVGGFDDFFHVKRVDIAGSISFRDIVDVVTRRYKRAPLRRVPDFRYLAMWNIDYIEIENFFLDFQMYNGRFNIHAFTGMIAEGEAKNLAWLRGWMKRGDPMPNELEIRIIRCKDLVKTKTVKPLHGKADSLAAAAAGAAAATASKTFVSGPLGSNAVVNAFVEEAGESDDDDPDMAPREYVPDPGASATSPQGVAGQPSERVAESSSASVSGGGGGAAPADMYGGFGPPQFNPHDRSVAAKEKQGRFDPYVVVTLRRDKQKTHTQTGTNHPMFNTTFFFHAVDPATVVHVEVYNRETIGKDTLLGQWVMTLKWMLGDPFYCWHEKGMTVSQDRWMRGWFPLINKRFRGVGQCGKIEMALQWRHVAEDQITRRFELPPLNALAQLSENSDETRLRMGDMARVKYWLNHEPFLFNIKRLSVLGFQFYIQDLFSGKKGLAEAGTNPDSLSLIDIPRALWDKEFAPRYGDPGITTYHVLYVFFRGIAPKVLDSASSHANLGTALSSIVSTTASQKMESIGTGLGKLLRGEVGGVQGLQSSLQKVGRAVDRGVQLLHRNVTLNKIDQAHFKTPITADDEDFLLPEPECAGMLTRYATRPAMGVSDMTDVEMERESERPGRFTPKWVELKGQTLFYRERRDTPKSAMFSVTWKIPLSHVSMAMLFEDRNEIMLHMVESEGIVTRLRGLEPPNVGDPSMVQWLEALRRKEMFPCVSWSRGATSSSRPPTPSPRASLTPSQASLPASSSQQ